jgi:hypothetical protein
MGKKHDLCGGVMPFRCFGDRRMTGRHYRVLGVIASHDRLSIAKGGQGCWAGQKRIVEIVGAGKSHVSEAISDLVSWKYISVEKGNIEIRKVYRVLYNPEDWGAFSRALVPVEGNYKGPVVPENRAVVPIEDCQLIEDIEELAPNKGIDHAEALINSAEAVLGNEKEEEGLSFDVGPRNFAVVLPDGTIRRVGVRTTIPKQSSCPQASA